MQGSRHCWTSCMLSLIGKLTLLVRGSSWTPARSSCWINFPESSTRCIFSSMTEGTSLSFIQLVFASSASHPSSLPNCLWTSGASTRPETTALYPNSDLLTSFHSKKQGHDGQARQPHSIVPASGILSCMWAVPLSAQLWDVRPV